MSTTNYCQKTNSISLKEINGEKICIFTFYGDGGRQEQEIIRHKQVMEWQQKVFTHFDLPINYVYNDFRYADFGMALDNFTKATEGMVDYWVHFDIDAIPLRQDVLQEIYDKIKDHRTLYGCASQSNHIFVNGTKQHAYCNSSTFALSTKFYKKLGSPSFRHTNRGDVAEELTWRAQELGYALDIVYPSSSLGLTDAEAKEFQIATPFSDLDNGFKFGMGTTYSDSIYHATMQIVPRSTEKFVEKCKEVIDGKKSEVATAKPVMDKTTIIKYLKTLPVAFMGGIAYDKGYGPDGKEIFNLRDSCLEMMKDVMKIAKPKQILEFGTHGGGSSCIMLALSDATVTSIDLCNGQGNIEWDYSYIDYGVPDKRPGMKEIVRLLNEWFPNRFRFIAGSSYGEETISKYNDRHYELCLVDGDHTFEGCRKDCKNAVRLGIDYLLVDDYTSSDTIQDACKLPELELVRVYGNIHSKLNIGLALFKNKNVTR